MAATAIFHEVEATLVVTLVAALDSLWKDTCWEAIPLIPRALSRFPVDQLEFHQHHRTERVVEVFKTLLNLLQGDVNFSKTLWEIVRWLGGVFGWKQSVGKSPSSQMRRWHNRIAAEARDVMRGLVPMLLFHTVSNEHQHILLQFTQNLMVDLFRGLHPLDVIVVHSRRHPTPLTGCLWCFQHRKSSLETRLGW